jgi:nucleoside 2-deoxyribosyltransferase
MKRLYLASPYGFSSQQRSLLLPVFVEILSELGADVDEPFQRNQQIKYAADKGWAYQIGQRDLQGVRECDGIFAIVNGAPPDEGVMVELGAAIALGKKQFLFRDDFRRTADCEDYPLNLMLFTGLPEKNWQDYFYTSVEEIPSPEKALVRWLQGRLVE